MSSDLPGLTLSLHSGQAFRWTEVSPGIFEGVAGGRFLRVSDADLNSISRDDFLYDYFRMDADWDGIKGSFSGVSPYLDDAVRAFPTLRILKQDPFETFVSFMISSCNNITRISGIISRLCAAYGEKTDGGHHAFPSLEVLRSAGADGIRACGAGFRADFIANALRMLGDGEIKFDEIPGMTTDEARRELMKANGIGPKIADCILLFGFGRFEVFPKDVWIKRVMANCLSGVSEEALGPYRGVAQQFLFMKAREDGLK